MSNFAYPGVWVGALGAAALIAVPILIHLINMMRHRRVEWAAMEFLLISQKKNRTWVLLKQLLLLAMRMAAIAAILFVVPQPKLPNQFGRLFGSSKTHHVVLVDDSYSMSDRGAGGSCFDRAKEVVGRIATEAAAQPTPQMMSLLRFSHARRGAGPAKPDGTKAGAGTHFDFVREDIGPEFPEWLKGLVSPMQPSETAAEPLPTLEAFVASLGDEEEDRRVIYLISDFRERQWGNPADLKERLRELSGKGARLYLVNCAETAHPNLAITELSATPGTRATRVPLFMEVAVKNFGDTPVKDVSVALEEDGTPRQAVTIPHIPSREVVKKRFQIHFEKPGEHQLVARLESDAVSTDNYRYSVLDVPAGLPVLMVDGSREGLDAKFLTTALESDTKVATGIMPRSMSPRDLGLKPLSEFHAVYLMNVENLTQSAVKSLEEYVASGGGLAVFLGPNSRSKFINDELYRDGQGLFPLPVTAPAVLRVDVLEKAPDMEVVDANHPALRVLTFDRSRFLNSVNVEQYFAVPKGWAPKADSTVKVVVQLRGGAPLVVEKSFGKGRVMAFLTTAAPVWNNWARNPTFVLAMLEMQAYLANQPAGAEARQVGSPLEVRFDPGQYERQARFITPNDTTGGASAATDATPDELDKEKLVATLADTDAKGLYRVRLSKKDGSYDERLYAFNVDPSEGDLKITPRQDLIAGLDPVKFDYALADEFQYNIEESGYNLFQMLLYTLIVLLIGEQILAWSASYHTPSARAARAKGGAV